MAWIFHFRGVKTVLNGVLISPGQRTSNQTIKQPTPFFLLIEHKSALSLVKCKCFLFSLTILMQISFLSALDSRRAYYDKFSLLYVNFKSGGDISCRQNALKGFNKITFRDKLYSLQAWEESLNAISLILPCIILLSKNRGDM